MGEIINVSPSGEATIKATISLDDYTRKGYRKVLIYLQDDRQISDKQRRFCYALIADIADWMGEHAKSADRELTKTYMKLKFITEDMEPLAQHLFSMANAPMDVINGFLKFLIDFILENDIPTKKSLLEYVDENSIKDYIYSCLINKKCCICGKPCDLPGNVQIGAKVFPLCREHQAENNKIGDIEFKTLYHLDEGIVADKTILRLFKRKT
ncbi:MAG: putative HNHc nuclease [Selenomonadaceae bacterium]